MSYSMQPLVVTRGLEALVDPHNNKSYSVGQAGMTNIVKNGTTGDFTLSADGSLLTIEATGLTGNCVGASLATITSNEVGEDLTVYAKANNNDIELQFRNSITGAAVDLTALVEGGSIYVSHLYITDE